MVRLSRVLKPLITATSLSIALSILSLTLARPARAFNYVADANGTWWGIQDAALPDVDTGSIRATQIGPGQSPTFSTSINGFGGIKVLVPVGYQQSIFQLGGIKISRSVYINTGANWGRWLDSFTNTTSSPLTIKVAFGGQSGMGASGARFSTIVNTSSGDAIVTPADSWVEVATPATTATLVGGPQVTVIGTPSTPQSFFAGSM